MKQVILLSISIAMIALLAHCSVKPKADFIFEPIDPKVGDTVVFINLSEDGVRYNWNFGDGVYSSDEDPQHVYRYEGTFIVDFVVHNGVRNDYKTQTITVLK